MKICFTDSYPASETAFFSCYHYQEHRASHSHYVDLRRIVHNHSREWLADLAESHVQLGQSVLALSPHWWLSPFSRLDARPWGNEAQFKPLFMARAIVQWIKENPQADSLTIVGSPEETASYLKELDMHISIQQHKTQSNALEYVKHIAGFAIKVISQFGYLITRIGAAKSFSALAPASSLLFIERFDANMSVEETKNYYYRGITESLPQRCQERITCVCLDQLASKFSRNRNSDDDNVLFVLDYVTLADCLWAFVNAVHVAYAIGLAALSSKPCHVGGLLSRGFWRHFLLSAFSKCAIMKELALRRIIERLVRQGQIEQIIYPYEEKGIERAIVVACEGSHVKIVGYAVHPQHELALSMKDTASPLTPRPHRYAVCGSAYVDFFEKWGGKPAGSVHVWGSIKSSEGAFQEQCIAIPTKVLLLLSHPHEMDVFVSWLKAEPRLTQHITYAVRFYHSVPQQMFLKKFADMTVQFPIITEAKGSFDDELKKCDVAIFNATSAGLLAIFKGKLALHVQLDDFFVINPCFNRLEFMLDCTTSQQFADRLNQLRQMNVSQLNGCWQDQYHAAKTFFSPIDFQCIERDLECTSRLKIM